MHRVRTLVAASVIGFAALTVAVPAAHADSPAPTDHGDKSWSGGDGGKWDHNKGEGKHERPHGGPHTGIGTDDGGLVAGGALIAGGLGLGVYALRRRTVSGAAQA
ncbi:LPXTG cell wall anchor domain-containing protein [Yinghuangia soli]|uniref:LPXTG cell wall anchor domain-containing protein n=1 Tax=Yinghuangia soli TaxID=2908204 RepID=A0AA41U2V3_9ACTN|nr:LPXTG cell wall anchor domain-containing protein [Yinghuangia soli]MCF2531061.1 LPXTG cell wall anchor domain-containing protein [Yinghuangia soli]